MRCEIKTQFCYLFKHNFSKLIDLQDLSRTASAELTLPEDEEEAMFYSFFFVVCTLTSLEKKRL